MNIILSDKAYMPTRAHAADKGIAITHWMPLPAHRKDNQ